jgi:aldose 1-epimerase
MKVQSRGVSQRVFGRLCDGQEVTEYTLDNGRGVTLSALDYGGIVTAVRMPDRDGRTDNVVLGFGTLEDYVRNPHFGPIVGRYANRIAGGRFLLDGQEHQLDRNDGAHSLHGGAQGFGTRMWKAVPLTDDNRVALELSYASPHGEQGYPGRLQVHIRYTLTVHNEWRIDFFATTDRPTVVNLGHHDYFNLAGCGTALNHRLTIPARRYLPVNRELIPIGVAGVAGTPFDFRRPTRVVERIRSGVEQLVAARGYDHCWLLDDSESGDLTPAARLEHESTGRVLEIETTAPALQFHSGNFLDGSLVGLSGQTCRQGDGVCLEPQQCPDAPNQPQLPSTVLRPGEVYTRTTVYRFLVKW